MPALARGQENTPSILNWFITINGVLTDMYAVEYQIFDIVGGLPGTQIFPVTPGDWEDVSNAPGKFSVGSYYAYDNTSSKGYTPELTATIGTHRIYWRWKVGATSQWQAGQEDFEVLVQSAGSSVDTYISIQDVRDAGIDVSVVDDVTVLSAIELWQAFIERACRQWFVAKSLIIEADGNDSSVMHFGVPIINIDYIKINNQTTELDTSCYKIYNAIRYPDERRNPRIGLIPLEAYDIYTAPLTYGNLIFRKGVKNQIFKGTFGFIEEDGSTPRLIKRALLKLVIEKLTNPLYISDPLTSPIPPPPLVGPLLEEWTDGHKKKYGQAGGQLKPRKPGLTGITSDQEILDIIKLYKNPIGIATPAHPSYR